MISNTVTLPVPAILARLGFKLFSSLTKLDLGLSGHRCMPFLQGICSLSKIGTYSRPASNSFSYLYPLSSLSTEENFCGIHVSLKGPWTLIFLHFGLSICFILCQLKFGQSRCCHIMGIAFDITRKMSQNQLPDVFMLRIFLPLFPQCFHR